MFPIAGQTAGPNGLNFFVDTHRWPGGVTGYGQRQAIQLVIIIIIIN